MFKHIVFQKFANREDAQTAAQMLRALMGEIPGLVSIEAGVNELDTERAFDLALIAVFEDIESYHAYDRHEAHQAVRAFIRPRRTGTASVDYTI